MTVFVNVKQIYIEIYKTVKNYLFNSYYIIHKFTKQIT